MSTETRRAPVWNWDMLWGSSIPTTYLNFTRGRVWSLPRQPQLRAPSCSARTSCGRSAHDPKGLRLNSDFVFATEIKILTRGTAVDPGRKWYRLELYPVIWNLHNFRVTIFVSTYTQKWPRGHPGAPRAASHRCVYRRYGGDFARKGQLKSRIS